MRSNMNARGGFVEGWRFTRGSAIVRDLGKFPILV
jgi:hypothetical protein